MALPTKRPSKPAKEVPARVFGILARNADVAVLLRRGPSKWFQLVRWDTATDTFDPGQWFHGRIYERRCDLSPAGSLLIYFAQKITARSIADRDYTYAWTAVSRPPYFTALALWPKGDCWHGGGLFLDDRHVMVNHHEAKPHPKHRPRPQRLKVSPNPKAHGEDLPIFYARLTRDGWFHRPAHDVRTRDRDEAVFEKPRPRRSTLVMKSVATIERRKEGQGVYFEEYALRAPAATDPIPLADVEWADFDHRGRLVFARAGLVYAAKVGDDGGVSETLLIDLNAQQPSEVIAPAWAREW